MRHQNWVSRSVSNFFPGVWVLSRSTRKGGRMEIHGVLSVVRLEGCTYHCYIHRDTLGVALQYSCRTNFCPICRLTWPGDTDGYTHFSDAV